ncbi:MAG: hypothetical protein ABIG11_05750 [bacterium]
MKKEMMAAAVLTFLFLTAPASHADSFYRNPDQKASPAVLPEGRSQTPRYAAKADVAFNQLQSISGTFHGLDWPAPTVAPLPEDASDTSDPGKPVTGNDPFESPGIMPSGLVSGLKVDTSLRRSARILTAQEAAPYNPQPGDTAAANFLHKNRLWVALIPPGAVQDIIIQNVVGNFGHAQLRLIMKEGREITLVPQVPGDTAAPVRVRDTVLKGFGILPEGWKMSDKRCAGSEFLYIYGFWSMETAVPDMSRKGRLLPVRQFRLKLSDEEKQAVLATALEKATKLGERHMFNMVNRSCVTKMMEVLDDSLRLNPAQRAAGMIFRHVPGFMPFYLSIRGLSGHYVKIRDFSLTPAGQPVIPQ